MLALLLVLDLGWGVHLGGGLEGGLITREPRPDAVAEAGMSVELLLPGRSWGVGFTAEAVERLTDIGASEEMKLDVSWRLATKDRRLRFGLGGGIRRLTYEDMAETVRGYDLVRLDMSATFARWDVAAVGATAALDFHVAWTFGCYRDTLRGEPVGDQPAPMREIACLDTITTTTIIGFGTSIRWR